MGIKLYKITCPTDLSYNNVTGAITLSPPINTEVDVVSISLRVEQNQLLKIDYALNVVATTGVTWSLSFQLRLYRDGTLINTRYYNRAGTQSGDQYIPFASTYVDMVPTTLASSTYVLKGIVTAATSASPVKTGTAIEMNIISFT